MVDEKRLQSSTPDPAEGTTAWEEQALLQAKSFKVHRFKGTSRDIKECDTFPDAIAALGDARREDYRVLLYVVTRADLVVCLPMNRIGEFIQLWVKQHDERKTK